jgi:hypothetical protein
MKTHDVVRQRWIGLLGCTALSLCMHTHSADASLIAKYSFEDGAGTVVSDSSGDNNQLKFPAFIPAYHVRAAQNTGIFDHQLVLCALRVISGWHSDVPASVLQDSE